MDARNVGTLCADIALAARAQDGACDVARREDADVLLDIGGDLPFEDDAIGAMHMGDATAALGVRDRLQLLIECRRVLAPGGELRLVEPRARETRAALARWAALVGLVPAAASDPAPGWRKPASTRDPAPVVSIVIPSSNPTYFAECIDSAIAQTYAHCEIVVSDDCESDAIARLVDARRDRADIRYVKNAVRLRTRRNYEQCLDLARGEYVKFLNDDDVLEPDCVATLVGAFIQVPGLSLATSNRLRIGSDSKPLADMPATRSSVDRDLLIDGVSLANAAIMYGLNFIGEPSTALVRKRDFTLNRDLGEERPFNFNGEEVRGAVDYAMWARVLVRGPAAFFGKRLSRFRTHGAQAQAREEVVARSIAGIRALQQQWIALGLFRRSPPHLVWARDLGSADAPWEWQRLLVFPGVSTAPAAAVAAWRSIARHPFDTGAIVA